MGLALQFVKVDLKTHQVDGNDFYRMNPKGYVPALVLDDGDLLTEGPAIVQYLADRDPEKGLVPKAGTRERYHCQEWLNYISTEIHKSFSPLFHKTDPEENKVKAREGLAKKFKFISGELKTRSFLMGESFSVADAYLFTVLRWGRAMKVEIPENVETYFQRVAARPAVQTSLKEEGLVSQVHAK